MNIPELLPYFSNWKRQGNGKFMASCPMPNHRDSDPSVSVTQDVETGKIVMYCWGCDTKAPMLVEALGLRVSDLFGDPGHPAAVKQNPQGVEVPQEELDKLSSYILETSECLHSAKEYISSRFNLSVEDGDDLMLGVDPGDDSITRPNGYEAFHSFVPHLIIPFLDPSGNPVGMQGRRLVDGDPRWRSKSGSGWSKIGCFAWNLEGPVVITEGPSDALAVVGWAKLPALAIRGASNTDEFICTQISEWLNGRPAIVVGDNGAVGEKFAREISEKLGIPSWLPPSEFSDIADFLTSGGTLNFSIEEAAPAEIQPEPTEEEIIAQHASRVANNLEGCVLDSDYIHELAQLNTDTVSLILQRARRMRPAGISAGEFDNTRRVLENRINNARPDPVGVGGGAGGHHVPAPDGRGPDGLPEILWNEEDQQPVTQGRIRNAMNEYNGGEYYCAALGQYVVVSSDDLIPLDSAGVQTMLGEMGHWRVVQGQHEKGHVPEKAVKWVSSSSWTCDLALIKRRVDVPFMLEDGRIISEPGFHEESGIYLLPRSNDRIHVPEVPEVVSDEDLQKAKDIFNDVLDGFEFKDNASRSNLVAMTLTSPLRELFRYNPMVPLLTSTAPQSGAGKGTSIRVPLSTAGVGPFSLGTTTYNSDENEFEKKLVGKLLKKSTYIFLDNIRAQVNSSVLEQMLTAANYDGRTLGYSEVNSLSTLVLWVCTLQSTGSFNRDLTRRCVPVELIKNWRGAWKHKNIEAYLADMRGQLLWACFVSARKWIQDGRPISNTRLDGYGGWTEVIGGILENTLGCENFLENINAFRLKQDSVSMTIDGMMERWLEAYGESAHGARSAVEEVDDPALHNLLGLRGNPSIRQVMNALDRQLASQEGYIIGNTHIWKVAGVGQDGKKLFHCVRLED